MTDDPKRIFEKPTPQEEALFEHLNEHADRLIAADKDCMVPDVVVEQANEASTEKVLFEVLMTRRLARMEDSQKMITSLLKKVLGYVRDLHDADKTLAQAKEEFSHAQEAWKKMFGSPQQ